MPTIGSMELVLIGKADSILAQLDDLKKRTKAAEDNHGRLAASVEKNTARMARAFGVLKVAAAGAVAAFTTGKIIDALNQAAETIDKIGKASARLQIPVRDLSVLRFAAGEAGQDFDSLSKMAGKAQRSIAELVANGQRTVRLGFITVPLTQANGQLRSFVELLPDLARGIESAGSAGEQLRLAEKIFGKGGGEEFVQLLKESGGFVANLAEQAKRAERLGVVFNDDQVRKLTAYRDAVGRVEEAWLGVKVAVMTEVAPALTKFLDEYAEQIGMLPRLIKASLQAYHVAATGDPEAQLRATQALAAVRSAGLELVKTTAVEGGRLLGTGFIEAIRVSIPILAPLFEDLFRDALGPVINDVLPPFVTPIAPSARGKLRDLEKEWDSVFAQLKEAKAQEGRFAAGPQNERTAGSIAGARNSQQVLFQALQAVSDRIGRQGGIVDQADVDRAAAIGRALDRAFANTGDAAARAGTRIGAALDKLKDAEGTLTEVFKPPAAAGSSEHPWYAMENLLSGVKQDAQALASYRFDLADSLRQLMEMREKYIAAMRTSAKDLREQFIPEEWYRREMDKIEGLHAAFPKIVDDKVFAAASTRIRDQLVQLEAEAGNFGAKMELTIRGFADSASNAFADLVVDGTANFDQLLKSWEKTLIAMAVKQFAFQPFFDAIGGIAGSLLGGPATTPATVPARGGVVDRPMLFPMARGAGLMGEAGPEAIMPLRRIGGDLGVKAVGTGGGVTVNVIDQRGSGEPVQVTERQGPEGRRQITMLIRDQVRGMIGDGTLDKQAAAAWGLRRRGAAR